MARPREPVKWDWIIVLDRYICLAKSLNEENNSSSNAIKIASSISDNELRRS
jgi:hypothetical protein